MAYREILADKRQAGLLCRGAAGAGLLWPGRRAARPAPLCSEAAQAYEQAAWTKNVGPELKIRSLLAAGECRDLNGERQLAVKDYQAAIDAGPNTSAAPTPRESICAAPTGETEESAGNGTALAGFVSLHVIKGF